VKMFDRVVIGTDLASLDIAHAIRSSLELFRLHVYLDWFVQKRNVLDFLAGNVPDSDYVVLCCHGLQGVKDPSGVTPMAFLDLSDQVDGKWVGTDVALTPANIPGLVKLPGRTIIALGGEAGREPLARAFLESGCRAYVGPDDHVDQDSTALFAIAFFYHLLAPDRDSRLRWTDRQAAELAARFDPDSREGTHVFRYYANDAT
jgi:hypothetical protein